MSAATRLSGIAAATVLLAGAAIGCAGRAERPVSPTRESFTQRGKASWYGAKFQGRSTASGELFDMNLPSAAHRTLPFGTVVRVRNLDNGREIDVRINDRGPFVRGRIVDLSRAAAEELGMIAAGVAEVRLWVVVWPGETVAFASLGRREPAGGASSTLQAGAFVARERAERLAKLIRRFDRRARVYSDGGWHRVQVRDLDPRDAEKLRERLRAEGIEAVVLDGATS
ncbi:MAG TPA: septal ring lytic transglycosylase RlpA family protein [Thermoanaerobaculia bacterium]|nr:septal ring lytic transglycosylase RlpA family protein [Thermoanaerobaculia bacterium]